MNRFEVEAKISSIKKEKKRERERERERGRQN
jgi:hypothetical protein